VRGIKWGKRGEGGGEAKKTLCGGTGKVSFVSKDEVQNQNGISWRGGGFQRERAQGYAHQADLVAKGSSQAWKGGGRGEEKRFRVPGTGTGNARRKNPKAFARVAGTITGEGTG